MEVILTKDNPAECLLLIGPLPRIFGGKGDRFYRSDREVFCEGLQSGHMVGAEVIKNYRDVFQAPAFDRAPRSTIREKS
jgi:hypothetical protein